MQKNTSQSGFSTVEIIIAISVVILLGVGGWFVWQRSQNPSSNNAQESPTSENKQPKETSKEAEQKYLVITEWGVKLPLTDKIATAYYEYSASSDGLASYVALHDTAFDALTNTNGETCKNEWAYTFYSISRVKTEDVSKVVNSEGAHSTYRQFSFTNEYQFGGLGQHQAGPSCLMLDDTPQAVASDKTIMEAADVKEQAFESAFDQLQPAN